MGFDQTVSAVFSLINDVDKTGILILVYEEFVAEKVHLHDSLLGIHGGVFKLLLSDNDVGLLNLLGLKRCRRNCIIGDNSLAQLLAELGFILSYLSFYCLLYFPQKHKRTEGT